MRFADITGQEDLKRHLARSVDAGRVSHAQLFSGAAGYGRSRWPWPMCSISAAATGGTAIRAANVPTAGRSPLSRIPTCIWSFR